MESNDALNIFNKKLKEHKEEEEERLIIYLSKKYKLPTLKIQDIQVNLNALQLLSESDSYEGSFAIYKKLKGRLSIAVNDITNKNLKKSLKKLEEKGFSYELSLVTIKTLKYIWGFYKDIVATSASTPGLLIITNEELEEAQGEIHGLNDAKKFLLKLKNLSNSRRISKNIEYLISIAISLDASDLHIEPTESGGVARYRLDGVLTDVAKFDEKEFKQLLTRLKLISGMKISTKSSQDGGFVIRLKTKTISVRTSVIPEDKGDSFVIRILDPENVIQDLSHLGLHPNILDVFKRNIQKPNGLILTTGPTGSGKTTTLYSFLNAIKKESIKIITLEDPIEYRLSGIVQTQASEDYSFANGLRSILRQDPDVILIGEIRDEEVADIAIQASLTGHLVFSTLHTNDALGALPRLEQFNIDPQSFSRAINSVIAQRLVRKICPQCSEKHQLTENQKQNIEKRIEKLPKMYKKDFNFNNIRKPGVNANTCEKCIRGYRGRVGLFEIFEVTQSVENAYKKGKGIETLKNAVKEQEVPFMEDDGLWKVLNGTTSLEELKRVLGVII